MAGKTFADVINDAVQKDNARIGAEAALKAVRDDAAKERKNADKLADDAEKSKAAADAKAAAATPAGTRDAAADKAMNDDAAKAKAAADKATQLEAAVTKQQQDIKKIQDDAKKAKDEHDKLIATRNQRARLGGPKFNHLLDKDKKWIPQDTPKEEPDTAPSFGTLRGDQMIPDGTFTKESKILGTLTTMTIRDGVAKYISGDFGTFLAGAMDKLIAQGSTKLTFNIDPPLKENLSYPNIEKFLDKLEKRAEKYGVIGEFPQELLDELRTSGTNRKKATGEALIARLEKINEKALIAKAGMPDPTKASAQMADALDKFKATTYPPVTAVTPPVITPPATVLTAADFQPKVDELEKNVTAIQARLAELQAAKGAIEKYQKQCARMDDESLRHHRDEHSRHDSDRKDALDKIDKEIADLTKHEAQFQKERKDIGDELGKVGVPRPATQDWQDQIDKLEAIQKAVDGMKKPLAEMQPAEIQKLRDENDRITAKSDALALRGPK